VKALLQAALAVALSLASGWAQAHRPSDAFLTLEIREHRIEGRWEIALRDLDLALGLDRNGDHQLSWGELRTERARVEADALPALTFDGDETPCVVRITGLQIHDRVDGRFAWLALAGRCEAEPSRLRIAYRFLYDLDPTHRLVLALSKDGRTQTAVLGPDHPQRTFELAGHSRWAAFRDYLRHGIWHIWIGYDHILFLLALLLPAVLSVCNGVWTGQARFGRVVQDVVAVVTSFTIAHSITLTLAALGLVRVPAIWIESAIAISVMLAALNNIVPLVERRRWALGFAFGLIHGFGFASVLGELGLPQDARLFALVAFNLGVEVGQLAIVGIALPLAFALRHTTLYRSGVRIAGSAGVAALAAIWFFQRSGLTGV
jgi:hypothetical protein